MIKKAGEFPATSTQILAELIPTHRALVVVPTSGFAHLQNYFGVTVWPRDLVGCMPIQSGSSNKEFCPPWSLFCPWSAEYLTLNSTHCNSWLLTDQKEKFGSCLKWDLPIPHSQESDSYSPPHYGVWSPALYDSKGSCSWMLHNPATIEQRSMWAELITPKQKPMTLFSQEIWNRV